MALALPLTASADPSYLKRDGHVSKYPQHWIAYVHDADGKCLLNAQGNGSKRSAMKLAERHVRVLLARAEGRELSASEFFLD